ncbi:conjugal transfer protein [Marinilactibacillus psychrotolerans]|uniref:TrsD/TraD family conjugative transfer protein n=1 Tax=Marinilactibacillus psychrotolerans TaxID=191770 RepID=UPI001C7CD912|nr:TrsD/TraD family conjugative transfer protein [Marinilactibacillus psychrotolerans]GEQ33599.1 conjugal transfer protein [Marinilactibacillus psychrotolerans]
MPKRKKQSSSLEFTFVPKPIKGKETISDMSLIQGMYKGYVVTKTGYLVALIEATGINLELLHEEEQTDVFDTFNSFLMSTLGDSSDEKQQYLDMTIPVDFDDYILSYKKRYLKEVESENPNMERAKLIASYIDDLIQKQNSQEMSTKKHLMVITHKIKDKTISSLDVSVMDLNEKVTQYISRLEDAFDGYDLQAKKLYADEVLSINKNLMNFSGH